MKYPIIITAITYQGDLLGRTFEPRKRISESQHLIKSAQAEHAFYERHATEARNVEYRTHRMLSPSDYEYRVEVVYATNVFVLAWDERSSEEFEFRVFVNSQDITDVLEETYFTDIGEEFEDLMWYREYEVKRDAEECRRTDEMNAEDIGR